MKTKLILLILFQIFNSSINGQYHFLETLNEVIIGPQNVDVVFPEQVDFYKKKYALTIKYIEEIQASQQEELNRLEQNVKKKMWNKNKIRGAEEQIELLEIEKEMVEEVIFLWGQLFEDKEIKQLDEKYDAKLCYDFHVLDETISSDVCSVKLDDRAFLSWEEYIWKKDLEAVKQKEVIQAGGTRWVKKRADKGCLSSDPTDCMVWCLVEMPNKVHLVDDKENSAFHTVHIKFKESEDGDFFWREIEVENSTERKYKVVDLRDERELHLIGFEEKTCE